MANFKGQGWAVIRYATKVTQRVRVADKTFSALRAFWDEGRIVELTLSAGFYHMRVRSLLPLEVDLEPGVRKAWEGDLRSWGTFCAKACW